MSGGSAKLFVFLFLLFFVSCLLLVVGADAPGYGPLPHLASPYKGEEKIRSPLTQADYSVNELLNTYRNDGRGEDDAGTFI